jgi:hypothetical protein
MQTVGTWDDILTIKDSIVTNIDTVPALKLFFENQIRHFYDRNADTFVAIAAAERDLMEEYFVQDEDGNFVPDGEGGYVLLEGETQEDYDADHAELMETKTMIYS